MPNAFIPFGQLTPAEVQGLVETAMGAGRLNALHAILDARIVDQINPSSMSLAPPW